MTADDLRARCDLDELEKAAKAATPGPWEAPDQPEGMVDVWSAAVHDDNVARQWEHDTAITPEIRGRDATFIAAANPAVLLEIVRRLREAEGIVRDLAERHSRYEQNKMRGVPCQNCSGVWGDHQENCTGCRAVDATRRESDR